MLELCLCQWSEQSKLFEMLVNYLGFSTVVFWKIAVPTVRVQLLKGIHWLIM